MRQTTPKMNYENFLCDKSFGPFLVSIDYTADFGWHENFDKLMSNITLSFFKFLFIDKTVISPVSAAGQHNSVYKHSILNCIL